MLANIGAIARGSISGPMFGAPAEATSYPVYVWYRPNDAVLNQAVVVPRLRAQFPQARVTALTQGGHGEFVGPVIGPYISNLLISTIGGTS